jgi:enoyl-CoA hydratase
LFILYIPLLLNREAEMSNAILVGETGKIKVLRFNRPEIRSPLSAFVLRELHELLDRIKTDDSVGGVVFTGVGDVFASGADLREIAGITGETAAEFALLGQGLMHKVETCGKPVMAAVNGFCFGGALDLALACGRRIASPNALFSHPGTGLGIITGWGGTQRLPRLIGEARALEMFFTTKRVTAAEALQMGLVERVTGDPLHTAVELLSTETVR